MKSETCDIALELQVVSDSSTIPTFKIFQLWASRTLERVDTVSNSLTIRIVDESEMAGLNRDYRHQDNSTNVLSFPFDPIEDVEESFLGDIVICAEVVESEALTLAKSLEAHWALMVIHGILHLCGYNHIVEKEADEMEALEVSILCTLGYPDPYVSYA